MKKGKVSASYNDVVSFIDSIGLLKRRNLTKSFNLNFSKFSPDFVQIFQKDDYENIYRTAMENNDFDFLLQDDSFFQFTYSNDGYKLLRYAYYENPFIYESYNVFLNSELGLSEAECGDMFLKDYEQYVSEAKLKKTITPFRYDYDENIKFYQEMLHTGSHIHIGHNNEIRIPANKILTPLGFSIFVLRNQYPQYYKLALEEQKFKKMILSEKNAFKECDKKLFGDNDASQLYIS